MENQTRPNLFTYATSELSQDAFICWLAAWADPKFKDVDPALHRTANQFLLSLIKKTEIPVGEDGIRTVDVTPQADRIDVLIEINRDADDKLAILIEDKTHTNHHGDQLKKYFEIVKIKRSYSSDRIVPIFFKTGYQSRFDGLGDFKKYLRKDFLIVLKEGSSSGVTNAIFCDFLLHVEEMDSAIRQFSTRTLVDWGDNDWRGFFMTLYDTRSSLYEVTQPDEANWNYVPNQTGGFIGFWWYFKRNLLDKTYVPYLQLNKDCLSFRIRDYKEEDRQRAGREANELVSMIARQLGINIPRSKLSKGKSMTVARWEGDYRGMKKDGTLDFNATLENLKKAQRILDTAFPA